MKFTVELLSTCDGGNHVSIRVTHVNSSLTHDMPIAKPDITQLGVDTIDELEDRVRERLRAFIREGGLLPDWGAIKTAVEAAEFDI